MENLDLNLKSVECEKCGMFILFPMLIRNFNTKKKMRVCQSCVHKIRIHNIDFEE